MYIYNTLSIQNIHLMNYGDDSIFCLQKNYTLYDLYRNNNKDIIKNFKKIFFGLYILTIINYEIIPHVNKLFLNQEES